MADTEALIRLGRALRGCTTCAPRTTATACSPSTPATGHPAAGTLPCLLPELSCTAYWVPPLLLCGLTPCCRHVKGKGLSRLQPLVMPRFIPTCTRPLLRALGELAAKHSVNVHSHIHEASARLRPAGPSAPHLAGPPRSKGSTCHAGPRHAAFPAGLLLRRPTMKRRLQRRWRAAGSWWTRLPSLMRRAC